MVKAIPITVLEQRIREIDTLTKRMQIERELLLDLIKKWHPAEAEAASRAQVPLPIPAPPAPSEAPTPATPTLRQSILTLLGAEPGLEKRDVVHRLAGGVSGRGGTSRDPKNVVYTAMRRMEREGILVAVGTQVYRNEDAPKMAAAQ